MPGVDAAGAPQGRQPPQRAEQRRLIAAELQQTSQRVNLFEKVKIPQCKEAIRVIKIALGDEQTAAVTRGKIAKSRVPETEQEVAS